MQSRQAAIPLATLALAAGAARAQILVYDQNTVNQYALAAAERVRPGEVTRARADDFGALITSQDWELVVMDFPSTRPDSGTAPLVDFVNDGGRAILSTWFFVYDTALFNAFGATGGASFSLTGASVDAAATPEADAVFEGVPMPWFDWQSNWGSDGAAFTTTPDTVPLAFRNGTGDPIAILANEGRTIATFHMDEWDGSTEAERVWENMMNLTLNATGCRPDLDGDGELTIFDFLAFQNAFDAMDPIADFDGDGEFTLFDFLAFQNEFDIGCE